MHRHRVLLIDDDDDLRTIVAMLFEMEGHEVDAVADGARAFARLAVGVRYDVIVLDLVMPGMNGWEFRRRQLADPVLARIPVVIASAIADPARVAGLAASAVLRKPVDPVHLLATVAAVASRPLAEGEPTPSALASSRPAPA